MLSRTTTLRSSIKSVRPLTYVRMYTEGATGTPRGIGQEDSFIKREKANEDFFIKQHEKEQMATLREQLKRQQKKIDEMESKIHELTK